MTENFSAYAVLNHRHVPEVLNHSGMEESQFSFTAQLLPIERGIMATNYLRLKRPVSFDEVTELYRGAYRESSFVRIYPPARSRSCGSSTAPTFATCISRSAAMESGWL